MWRFTKNGDTYAFLIADDPTLPQVEPAHHWLFVKNGKLIGHVSVKWRKQDGRWVVRGGTISAVEADGHLSPVEEFNVSDGKSASARGNRARAAADALAYARDILLPRRLAAQTVSWYDPLACLGDMTAMLTGVLGSDIPILDTVGMVSATQAAMAFPVDCGSVTSGGVADPGAVLLPTVYIYADPSTCYDITLYMDVYVDDVYVGSEAIDTQVCT